MFHHVSQENDTKALCEKLKGRYERKTTQNKTFVTRKLMNLKLKGGRYVAKHLSEFQDLANQMVAMKLIINDELQALLFLSSLPDNYETLVVSLNNSTPNDVLQLATVKDSLFNEESRRKDMGKHNAQALVTKNMSKSKSRHFKEHGKSKSIIIERKIQVFLLQQKMSHKKKL